jgi:FlaA1/EpsC-like NDP-sugar epimerase
MNMKIFANMLRNLSRNKKLAVIFFADFWTAFLCWIIFGPPLTFLIATNFSESLLTIIYLNIVSFLIPVIFLFSYFFVFGFYRSLMKFFDSKDSVFRAMIGSFIFGFSWGIVYLAQYEIMRTTFLTTVILQSFLLSSVLYAFLQISRDIARLIIYPTKESLDAKPVLIYGAGTAGNELYQLIKQNSKIKIIGFYDNSFNLKGASINNIKIYGKNKHLKKLSEKFENLEIYLAIPSLTIEERRKIISSLEKYKVAVRSIPAFHEIVADEKKMAEIQDLSIDDILPRKRVGKSEVSFEGITAMITGAGGSIGSEVVRQILIGKPKKIILFELSEINLYSIESELNSIKNAQNIPTEIVGILGDVKDQSRLNNIMTSHNVEYVYHAAAYKHVPIVEYYENIAEGIKNNVFGTKSLCDAAIKNNVKKVIVISTDKAVRPTNVMGASKRFAEMIVQSSDNNKNNTVFCMVRFGNVMNSSGSVIPLFRKQISEGGPITITHKKVTRYFMTISEASSLVIQAGEYANGGEVFILDMGEQVKIIDLAKRLIYLSGRNVSYDSVSEGIEIKEVGLRPGEKLYEELLISGKEENTPNDKIFKSNENFLNNSDLDIALAELQNGVENDDVSKIKSTLKKYVEGFMEA